MGELELGDPEPLVIQLYPDSHIDGEDRQGTRAFLAYQLVCVRIDRERRDQDADAEFVCARAMFLFGNFLVLSRGVERPEAERIREILERKSREKTCGEAHPRHAVLLSKKEARLRPSFFTALVDALVNRSKKKPEQGLAAVLIAMFFSKHPKKMLDLAHSITHYSMYGGSPGYTDD